LCSACCAGFTGDFTRIEGRGLVRPKRSKFDCKKREFSKAPCGHSRRARCNNGTSRYVSRCRLGRVSFLPGVREGGRQLSLRDYSIEVSGKQQSEDHKIQMSSNPTYWDLAAWSNDKFRVADETLAIVWGFVKGPDRRLLTNPDLSANAINQFLGIVADPGLEHSLDVLDLVNTL
jgi:hypothetical protein